MFSIALIGGLIVATVAVAGFVFAPRMGPGQLVYALKPDRPHPFGYKMAWLAIRTRDTQRVIDLLGLGDVQNTNWDTGLGTIYSETHGESHLFVSPPVQGWTFVVGLALPHPLGKNFTDKSTPLLLALGGQFIEVQYFFTYPLIDFFAWARLVDGKLLRAFAIGDEGVLWDKGKLTKEEKTLGLKLFELRGVRGRRGDAGGELVLYPTEDHVMRLAAKWSLDPTRLDAMNAEPALGYIGRVPATWKPERIRKSA